MILSLSIFDSVMIHLLITIAHETAVRLRRGVAVRRARFYHASIDPTRHTYGLRPTSVKDVYPKSRPMLGLRKECQAEDGLAHFLRACVSALRVVTASRRAGCGYLLINGR